MASEQELNNLKGKLNALSGVLRLGHEAFQKNSVNNVALHIVNNTRLISAYDRASLADMRGRILVEAVTGQPVIDQNSEFSTRLRELLSSFGSLQTPLKINEDFFKETSSMKPSALDSFKALAGEHHATDILLVPLLPPPGGNNTGSHKQCFMLVLEFFKGINPAEESIMALLAQHYAEAIWHKTIKPRWNLRDFLEARSLSPLRITLIIFCIFIISLFAIRVRQYAVADFEIIPDKENISYSRINGIISKVLRENGTNVTSGEPLIELDRDEINYNLAAAIKSYEQTSAELDVTRQKSFNNSELLGKSRILMLKKEQDAINIEKFKWMLSQVTINAPKSGVLSINGRDKLEGKPVRAGEKLCEVIIPSDLIAEIYINEKDASVIGKDMAISMYLHTQPEKALRGVTTSISPKPVMTEDRHFCYVIKVKPDVQNGMLICGMRGIARVGGERVSLGYYLFRSSVLWWRKI